MITIRVDAIWGTGDRAAGTPASGLGNVLGDVGGIVRIATMAFGPQGLRAFAGEVIKRRIANDQEAALAEAMDLSVEDYRAEMDRQAVLSWFGASDFIMEDILEEQPKRGVGFVQVGSDTWLPRGLYEERRWVERQEARRPQRGAWPGCRPGRWEGRAGRRRSSRRRPR